MGQDSLYWRDASRDNKWFDPTAADNQKPWYRSSDGWTLMEPDISGTDWWLWSTNNPNNLYIGNNHQPTMDVNDRWWPVQSLTFQGGATTPRTLSGQGMYLHGAKIENQSSAHHTINSGIAISNWSQINPASGNMTFNGTIKVNSWWIDVYGNSGKTNFFYGVLDANGGNGGLTIKQNSYAVLTNNNTFGGNIDIEKGGVHLGHEGNGHTNAAGLGTGEIKVGTNAVLELHASVYWRPRKLELYGNGISSDYGSFRKHQNSGSGTATWPGAILFGQDVNICSDQGTLSVLGAITESGGNRKLVKKGGGTLKFSGISTYSGGTYIDDGILALNHSRSAGTNLIDVGSALYPAVSAELQLSKTDGGIRLTNTINLRAKSGAASRTLSSLNTSGENRLCGAVYIDTNSQLRLYMPTGSGTFAITNVISGHGSIWLDAAGGTIAFGGNNTYTAGTYVGRGTLQLNYNNNAAGTGDIYLSGEEDNDTNATLLISAFRTITNTIISRPKKANLKATIAKTGAGNAEAGGVLHLWEGDYSGNRQTILSNNTTGSFTFSGGINLCSPTGGEEHRAITVYNQVIIDGPITNPGDKGLVMRGTGTLILNDELQTPFFQDSGNVVLGTGCPLTNAYQLGTADNGDAVPEDASLTFQGNTRTIDIAFSVGQTNDGAILPGKRQINFQQNAGQILTLAGTVDSGPYNNRFLRLYNTQTSVVSSVISNAGGIIKDGSAPLTLSGANTYSSGTIITSYSYLVVTSDENLGASTGPLAIYNWGTLLFNDDMTLSAARALTIGNGHFNVVTNKEVSYGGAVTGSGQLNKSGAGRLNLSGTSDNTGVVEIQAGTLAIGNDRNLGTSPGSFNSQLLRFNQTDNNTLMLTNTSYMEMHANRGIFLYRHGIMNLVTTNVRFNAPIGGSAWQSLIKRGSGKMTLAGANTFPGNMKIEEGEVELLATPSPLRSFWIDLGSSNTTADAQLSLGPGVVLTNGITVYTNILGETGDRLIAMYPSSSAQIITNIYLEATNTRIGVLTNCTLDITAPIIQSCSDIDRTVKKVWPGTLVFSTPNTNYFHTLHVEDGTVRAEANSTLWDPWVNIILDGGSTYDLNGFGQRMAVLEGGGTFDLGSEGTATVFNGYARTFSGDITGTGTLVKAGDLPFGDSNGRMSLSLRERSFAGTTRIESGTIRIYRPTDLGTSQLVFDNGAELFFNYHPGYSWRTFDSSRTFTLEGDGTMNYDGPPGSYGVTIEGTVTGPGGLIKCGNFDTLTLAADNDYEGTTVISGGVIRVTHVNALGETTGGTEIRSGGALLVTNASPIAEPILMSGSGYSSRGALQVCSDTTFNNDITLTNDARITAPNVLSAPLYGGCKIAGLMDLGGNTLYVGGDGYTHFLDTSTITNADKTTDDGAIYKDGSAGDWEAVLIIMGANPYLTGNITLAEGEIWFDDDNALGPSGTLYLHDSTRLCPYDTTPYSVSKKTVIQGDVTLGWSSAGLTLAGNVDLDGDTRSLEIDGTSTISGNITNGGLTKVGSATLTLSGANTYTGITTISSGTLRAGAANTLSAASAMTIGPGTTLDLNNHSQTVNSLSGTGSIILGSATLTTGADNTNTTYSGVISGTGRLTKNGSGTLTLSNTNTFTGAFTLNKGKTKTGFIANAGIPQPLGASSNVYFGLSGDGGTIEYTGENASAEDWNFGFFPANSMGIIAVSNNSTELELGEGTKFWYPTSSFTYDFRKQGPGLLFLSQTTTNVSAKFNVCVDEGTLKLRREGVFRSTGSVTVSNNAQLVLEPDAGDNGQNYMLGGTLSLAGTGVDGSAALRVMRGTNTLTSSIEFTDAAAINIETDVFIVTNTLTGTGNMTKAGEGTLRLDADSSSTYSGGIAITNGILEIRGNVANSTVLVTNATLNGAGTVGALTVNGGSIIHPGNSPSDTASLNCSGLTLRNDTTISLAVTSGSSATNGMIQVSGNMTLPDPSDQITVDLSYIGSHSNYFRRIPFLYYSGATHGSPHTNWVITGAGPLNPYMKVKHQATGSGYYYIQGATPYSDITNGIADSSGNLGIKIYADTVEDVSYDLIYYDALLWPSGSSASNVIWTKHYSTVATGTTTIFTNSLATLNAGYLRFLRVSPMDAWQNETEKFASKQVYVAKKAILYPGRNWISLPGVPDTPTVSNVFGYGLPSGDSLSGTVVYFYSQGEVSIVNTGSVRLASGSSWVWHTNGAGNAANFEIPVEQGFFVDMPSSSAQYLGLAGALRTNTQTITVGGSEALTFVSIILPANLHPADLGLLDCGFTGSYRPARSDHLYVWDRPNQRIKYSMSMWYNTTNERWEWSDWSPVTGTPISQDDAILLYTKNSGYTWTNNIYYSPPTSNMAP